MPSHGISEVFALVRATLITTLGLDPAQTTVDSDTALLGLPDISSLAMMRVLAAVEDQLGIELVDDDLVAANTVGELAAAVAHQCTA